MRAALDLRGRMLKPTLILIVMGLMIACGNDDDEDSGQAPNRLDGESSRATATMPPSSDSDEGSMPEELADFPIPENAIVHAPGSPNCDCAAPPDGRGTVTVLVITPLPAAEVIALLDARLEASGYLIETRDVSELQGVWEFTKGGLPGRVHVFRGIGGEMAIDINLFTAGVR